MARTANSHSPIDRAAVFVGGVLCAIAIGWSVKASAVAGDGRAPRFAETGATPASELGRRAAAHGRSGAGDATAELAALEWSVINSYDYAEGLTNLPDAVRALDGKAVVLRGFLNPLYEYEDIHEFTLVACGLGCCYGSVAGISGQVQVQIAGEHGLPRTNEPLEVRGTFHVRETKEQGCVLSIYQIDDATVRIVGYR